MNLDIEKWGSFRIADLFPVLQNGKANQGMLSDGDECFYIGAKKDDNGVMFHCAYDSDLVQKGNCIIFICNGQGSVGYANYMDADFIGTTDIVAGYNENLNQYNGLFIATILCQERPKYSFGRKWKTHLRDTIIKLPQTKTNTPDWDFMERFIKTLHYKELRTSNKPRNTSTIDTSKWKEFVFDKIFDIQRGDSLYITDSENGGTPYASASAENNGISAYLNVQPNRAGNCIVINYDGSVGEAYYHAQPFFASEKIVTATFKNHSMTPYSEMFITTLIMKEKYRFSYGRKWTVEASMKSSIRKLPVQENADGTPLIDTTYEYSSDGYVPDWLFMENYIKSLPYSDRI